MKLSEQTNPEGEEVWAQKASKGDLDAFNQLVLRYQDIAYHYAYTLLGDALSAEDIAQDSFIKAYLNLRTFRGGSFRAWLLKIVTNSAFDLMRQVKRHPTLSLEYEGENGEDMDSPAWLADPSASVEEMVDSKEDAQRLQQILDQLPEIHRSILILADLYEMDYSEVAEILKVPLGTVKSRLGRARMQMKRLLMAERPILNSPSWERQAIFGYQ